MTICENGLKESPAVNLSSRARWLRWLLSFWRILKKHCGRNTLKHSPARSFLNPASGLAKALALTVLRALNNRAKRYAELDAMGPEARAEHDAAIVELREKLGFGTQAKQLCR